MDSELNQFWSVVDVNGMKAVATFGTGGAVLLAVVGGVSVLAGGADESVVSVVSLAVVVVVGAAAADVGLQRTLT